MFGMGGSEILVILIVALLFLGPDKLPSAAKSISKGIRDIKKQSRALQTQIENDEQIGGAIRDLKSALRGEEFPVKPKPLKPRIKKELAAGDLAAATGASDATTATAALTVGLPTDENSILDPNRPVDASLPAAPSAVATAATSDAASAATSGVANTATGTSAPARTSRPAGTLKVDTTLEVSPSEILESKSVEVDPVAVAAAVPKHPKHRPALAIPKVPSVLDKPVPPLSPSQEPPRITLPKSAGEAGDVEEPGGDDDLASLIKPAQGSIAKGSGS